MSLTNLPTQFIFLTFSISLTFSLQTAAAAAANPSLIQRACKNGYIDFDSKLCVRILGSDKRVALATNFLDLSIAIMEGGISNATDTRKRVEDLMGKPDAAAAAASTALGVCKQSYDAVIASMRSALTEVRDSNEYSTATYDLLLSGTDNILPCKEANVGDRMILSGNTAATVYGLAAYDAVDVLSRQP